MSISETWTQIVRWCADNAPATAGEIAAPAGPAALADAERATGLKWPEELRVWYSLQDGIWSARNESAVLPPLFNPLSLSLLVETYQRNCELAVQYAVDAAELAVQEAEPAGELVGDWLTSFLPFGQSALGSDLFVDLRFGELHGCVRESHDEGVTDPVCGSVSELLENVLAAMTDGTIVRNCRLTVVDGFVLWEPPAVV